MQMTRAVWRAADSSNEQDLRVAEMESLQERQTKLREQAHSSALLYLLCLCGRQAGLGEVQLTVASERENGKSETARRSEDCSSAPSREAVAKHCSGSSRRSLPSRKMVTS